MNLLFKIVSSIAFLLALTRGEFAEPYLGLFGKIDLYAVAIWFAVAAQEINNDRSI